MADNNSTSMSAAAQQYQANLKYQSQNPPGTSETPALANSPEDAPDAVMKDLPAETVQSPAPQPQSTGSTPVPQSQPRTSTPGRTTNGLEQTSRPGSMHPDGTELPAQAASHGAPARKYLNEKVTGVLMEGMKMIAKEQPNDPLRVLGEYLLQRSRELESK
ncbi:hypothetical protein L228DRAFT_242257 [Xylona heveae TC161]|uniref:Uncharacterized protein n=1 Tax=Xylona heveae (strain CBS 132557 / TC161) TaxID=1328760 RepID=A0A165J855_XYLHT|nr:hypothetical protein L228DRAFT_242257 [Xylona heveae TC161]KZF25877.1 hypothetical protein L228DRAFT_242257 [Xylona heveae TC161]